MKAEFLNDGRLKLVLETNEDHIIINELHFKSNERRLVFFEKDAGVFLSETPKNSPEFTFDAETWIKIMYFLGRNEKLEALKVIKTVTGLGLKESKEIMDELAMKYQRVNQLLLKI